MRLAWLVGLIASLGCSKSESVKCGSGTEEVDGKCLLACAEGEKRDGEACVSKCGDGTAFAGGECLPEAAAFIKNYGKLADEMCACKGKPGCAAEVVRERDKLREPSGHASDADRAALEPIKARFEECQPDSQLVSEFTAIKDEMCACKDKACAEGVNQKFEVWLKRNESSKGGRAEQEKAKAIAEDYTRCMMSAMGAL